MNDNERQPYPGAGACEICGHVDPCVACNGPCESTVKAASVNESLRIAAEQTYELLRKTAISIKRNLNE